MAAFETGLTFTKGLADYEFYTETPVLMANLDTGVGSIPSTLIKKLTGHSMAERSSD